MLPPVKFPSDAPVTAAKLDALRARIAQLRIALDRVDEQAVRAGGPGGQKVNKTSSGVRLAYPLDAATTVIVKWTRERSRALNRFLALRELVDEIEERVSPATSARVAERARRRYSRYGASPRSSPTGTGVRPLAARPSRMRGSAATVADWSQRAYV